VPPRVALVDRDERLVLRADVAATRSDEAVTDHVFPLGFALRANRSR
jgi:hypothetical protein